MESYTYTQARDHLAELWDQVTEQNDPVRLTRRGAQPVVLLDEKEYDGLLETAHLLRSPANAARLMDAIQSAETGIGTPRTIESLRAEFERDEPQ